MLHFDSDYMEGMHPRILQRLSEINMEQQTGYGTDSICKSAREKIQKVCSCPDAEIHFLTGGTQTNAIVIKSLLRPYEGVIAADTGHINVHEAGAMFGEAVVFPRHLVDDFFTIIKQNGALLAKGWYLGVQFDELFSHDLYIRCGLNAIETSDALKEGLKEKGYGFFVDSPTNQQFVILENNKMAQLTYKVSFSYWGPYDEDHTIVRFATSWATQMEQVKQLIELM